jgi:hypothetical protein
LEVDVQEKQQQVVGNQGAEHAMQLARLFVLDV